MVARAFWPALVFLVLLISPGPVAAGSQEDLSAAFTASDKGDWKTTEKLADAAIRAGDLRGDRLAVAYYLRGLARWNTDRPTEALEDFTAALTHADRTGDVWAIILRTRMYLHIDTKKWREAGSDFQTLAHVNAKIAKEVMFESLSSLVWSLEEVDETATLSVLRWVRAIGYEPTDPSDSMDYLVGLYVRLLAQAGETAVALPELSRITDADTLIGIRVDRRHAPLWSQPGFEAATNPSEIAPRQLAEAERRTKQAPTVLGLVTRYVVALRAVGDFAKAVSVARAALANPSMKSDGNDELWLRNELVYALRDSGKVDEALAEMEPILKVDPAKNGDVVSQLINFGVIMLELGRPEEAARIARRAWDGASPFGRMFISMVDVCAQSTTNIAAAERTLLEMRKTEGENYSAVMYALLCLDRQDEGAALLKKRLSIADARNAVLTAAQTYKEPPFVAPKLREILQRLAAIIARPDVKQEIEKYGRIESFPFISGYWGNI